MCPQQPARAEHSVPPRPRPALLRSAPDQPARSRRRRPRRRQSPRHRGTPPLPATAGPGRRADDRRNLGASDRGLSHPGPADGTSDKSAFAQVWSSMLYTFFQKTNDPGKGGLTPLKGGVILWGGLSPWTSVSQVVHTGPAKSLVRVQSDGANSGMSCGGGGVDSNGG
jgi:hypothetical protein